MTHPGFADTLDFEASTGEATELKLTLRQPYGRCLGSVFFLVEWRKSSRRSVQILTERDDW